MDKHENFRKNIRTILQAEHLSITELSQKTGVPRSTIQSVLRDGQTTLNTALRLADGLGIPISVLIDSSPDTDQLQLLHGLFSLLGWFNRLSYRDQQTILEHMRPILEVLQHE